MIMQKMDNFRQDFDGDLLMTKNAVFSFLAGNLLLDTQRNSECFYIDDEKMAFFKAPLKQHLAAFLSANPYYESAMFIIEKDTTPPLTQKSFYAPLLIKGEDNLTDLALSYDLSLSPAIKTCKATLKPLWTLPSQRNNKKIVCFHVPICRKSDGSYFATFSISLNISTIDDKIARHLPYGEKDSEMVITDQNGRIVSAYPNIYKDFKLYSDIWDKLGNNVTDLTIDTENNRRIINYNGTEYFQYRHTLKCAPWTIITGCKSDAIYAEANNLKRTVIITSLIGMLLMLISCIVVTKQIHLTYRKKQAAEQELDMASKVQMSLLRKNHHDTPGHTLYAYLNPARQAGGDLYDYADVDGKLIFCIGDVSGKGMPAALFMTQVMSLFRSAVKHSADPAFILTYINQVLADDNPDMTFCTLFVATLQDNTLTYANAGHDNPLLLTTPTHATPTFLSTDSDFPIGIEPDCQYTSGTYTLQQGDTILLYTDGVTEAMDRSHQLFGAQRIVDTLSSRTDNDPHHAVTQLLSSVATFVNGAEQSDDITILAISRKH